MTQLVTRNRQIIVGDVLEELKKLPSNHVHCVVTSPPYYGLRNYGTSRWEGGDPICNHTQERPSGSSSSGLQGSKAAQGHRLEGFKGNRCLKCGATKIDHQIGLEKTPKLYVKKMVQVFNEVRRVLRPDGVCWLNLGDSYWGSWGNSGNRVQLDGDSRGQRERSSEYMDRGGYDNHRDRPPTSFKIKGFKNKDLIGIPWMMALALRDAGWWLRSEIIWAKKNCMPESVTDRPSKSHEHIFMLTKSADYFYDNEAVKEEDSGKRSGNTFEGRQGGAEYQGRDGGQGGGEWLPGNGRNRRDVWHISTTPSQVAHYAVFPPAIPLLCIRASTSMRGCCPRCGMPWARLKDENKVTVDWVPACQCKEQEVAPSVVLDPFHGSGTTGAVAEFLGQRYIGIELNPESVGFYDARCAEVRRNLVGGDAPDREEKDGNQISLFEESR